jgi:hypothetical protein
VIDSRGGRRRIDAWSAMLLSAACQWGCAPGSAKSDPPCVVTAGDGVDREMLVSEAEAAIAAGEPCQTTFHVAVHGTDPVTLQLASIGCNCYSMRAYGRGLNIGDPVEIPAGGSVELLIDAQPNVVAGVKRYYAEFSGTGSDGTSFTQSLTSRVQTFADIVVRPEIVTWTAGDRNALAGEPIRLQVEQHVRSKTAEGLHVAWNSLPDDVSVTMPEPAGTPVEIRPGLWRARWHCELRIGDTKRSELDSPLRLPVTSLLNGRQVAEAGCLLILRRESGVQAPRLVHLGRLTAGVAVMRRVQLRSLDGRAFAVLSAASREGVIEAEVLDSAAAVEHWLEVRATATHEGVDDELTIRTDHPESLELRLFVRGIGP